MKPTMQEFKTGTLRSGSKGGPVVKSRAQAIAIGLSEQRKTVPKAPAMPKAIKAIKPMSKSSRPAGAARTTQGGIQRIQHPGDGIDFPTMHTSKHR